MNKNLLRKTHVIIIIILFIGMGIIASSSTNVIVNKSYSMSFDGNILYVGGSGPGNYTKIQDAIDNASGGDIIYIYNGTYYENVVIDKSIHIIGENRTTTILTWNEKGDIIHIIAEGVSIQHVTVKDGKQDGIGVYANNTIMSYSIIENNRYGIHLSESNHNKIHHNNITDNRVGVNLYYSSHNEIKNNSISNNFHFGIHLGNSFYNHIQENSLSFHKSSIDILDSGENVISSNTITGNTWSGIGFFDSTNITIRNNTFDSSGIIVGGYNVNHWTTHMIENNYVNDKPIYYYKNNHEGTQVPSNAAQVILANCTSIKVSSLNTSNVDTGIILGFSHFCEISETQSNHNNYYGISLVCSHNNTLYNCSFSNNDYYGVAIWSSSNTTISHSILCNNKREAIHLLNTTDMCISDNNISKNWQGLYLNEVYHSIISTNHFMKNTGEAIYCHTTVHNTTFTDNIILGNSDNGMELFSSIDNTILRNNIYDNVETGIHINSCYNTTISNNDVKNNTHGISMSYAYNSIISMNNIIKNEQKGISVVYGYDTHVKNNNFEGNAPNAYFQCYGSHTLDGLLIKGFFEGLWNSFRITFDGNYWGRSRVFPVLIAGKIISFGYPAWIGDIEYKMWKVDWHPAKEPYDI
jgi:parallel beta-helix repeat protein